jgi:hexosaminidase
MKNTVKIFLAFSVVLLINTNLYSQQVRIAKVALIQASALPNQDPFMGDYDQSKVRPGMIAHFNKLVGLMEKAGQMGADIVCGPEDMQHIGSYGLNVDIKDPASGEILFNSLAVQVPCPLTDQLAEVAKKYKMYIVAPIYEKYNGKTYNSAVVFDRQGNIIGKHWKTLVPVMETWLVDLGSEFEVYQTDFGKFAVATCWEMFYPEISTVYALKGAQLIFNPTMAMDSKPGEGLSTAPAYITRARDNSVYIAPVVLGTEGTGIIDFNGSVVAEAVGQHDTVVMADIDFSKERLNDSQWWKAINGTDNEKAIHFKSRRPETYSMLTNTNPPILADYKDVHLTTGDRDAQLKAVREVDYGPKGKDGLAGQEGLASRAGRAGLEGQEKKDLQLLPWPRELKSLGKELLLAGTVSIVTDEKHSASDSFTEEELIKDLKGEFGITAEHRVKASAASIILTRKGGNSLPDDQSYRIKVNEAGVTITARGDAGMFWGTQTLLQLIRKVNGVCSVPGVEITDWPEIKQRAVHYDTKHHQDKASYVKAFIKDLSRYKVNILVWEWEDKFAYPSHPEIGAPGAFTMSEMQEFTRFAARYHIQIVPLVQGLGHVSFILKWPQFKDLREIPSSNWEFCPLKEGSYKLLFDLWKDATAATPGSEYFHIGSDETYELGACDACAEKAKETGKSGLYQLFVNKSAAYLTAKGRKVMAWEPPMGWQHGDSPAKGINPVKGLVFTESYEYETKDFTYAEKSRELGYEVFAYDPNPSVVPMMVPYYFELSEKKEPRPGSLEKSRSFLTDAAKSGKFNGMICTSWDDDDAHNQMWMMHFVNAATYSWNHEGPSEDQFRNSFFKDYYGTAASEMDELFRLINEGAYYFAWTMERNVWHYGEIGQTHLPDLPRGNSLEYDPFWNTQYREKVKESELMLGKMNKALELINRSKINTSKHAYDLEIMRTTADLIRHTCLTYIDLSNLEYTIRDAHVSRFEDCNKSLKSLLKAQNLLENTLNRRDSVFKDLVAVYEETRLPRGYSTPEKQYFWQQDRARHFGFRQPDMSFLIYDEQLLDIEGYLEKLKNYIEYFKANSME